MSIHTEPEIAAARRAWLPLVQFILKLKRTKEPGRFIAANPEMTSWEAFGLAAFFYVTSLTFLGACMLPGLAIVPFGEFLAWPILLLSHIILLHATVAMIAGMAVMLKPALVMLRIPRMAFQTTVLLSLHTSIAVIMAFVGGIPSYVAWIWLGFVALNAIAAALPGKLNL